MEEKLFPSENQEIVWAQTGGIETIWLLKKGRNKLAMLGPSEDNVHQSKCN